MNRRSFFGTLAGAIVAAPVVPALAETMPTTLGSSWVVPSSLKPAGLLTFDGEYLVNPFRLGDVVGIEGLDGEFVVTAVAGDTITADHQ